MFEALCPRCGAPRAAAIGTCPRCGAVLPAPAPARVTLGLTRESAAEHRQTWLLRTDEALIGRQPPAEVVVGDESVSRRQARLYRSGGGFVLQDLNSKNATLLNDQVVEAPVLLKTGDRITVGQTVLEVEILAETGSSDDSDDVDAHETAIVELGQALVAAQPRRAPELSAADPTADIFETQVDGLELSVVDDAADHDMDEIDVDAEIAPEIAQELAEPEEDSALTLEDLGRASAALGSHMSLLVERLAALRERFEQAGGRQAQQDILEQSARTQANPADVRELLALAELADSISELLEVQAALADLLWPLSSRSADSGHQEVQLDGPDDDPIVGLE